MRVHTGAALLAAACTLLSGCPSGRSEDEPLAVAPAFSIPEPVNFGAPLEVALSTATTGASIHYTIDGTEPTSASPVYATPLTLTDTTTIRAYASCKGFRDSAESSVTYTHRPVNLQVDAELGSHFTYSPTYHPDMYLNRFTPAAEDFPFLLRTVRIFNYTVYGGTPVRLAVWSDPDGDLSTVPTLVHSEDGVLSTTPVTPGNFYAWSEFQLSTPVLLTGPGDILVGYGLLPPTPVFATGLSDTSLPGRSLWLTFTGAFPDPLTWTPSNSYVYDGATFLIRASN